MRDKIRKAVNVGCPIITYSTADPAAAVHGITDTLEDHGVVCWDVALGLRVLPGNGHERGVKAMTTMVPKDANDPTEAVNLAEVLCGACNFAEDSVLVVFNAQRHLSDATNVQAIWNCRDEFKSKGCMLVLMGTGVSVPVELSHDVIEFDEPLPTVEELRDIVVKTCEYAGLESPEEETIEKAAQACRGLSAFAAEQLTALSLSKDGPSVTKIWAGKHAKINETPGLQVVAGGSYDDVAGCNGIKKFLGGIMGGREAPNAVVFVDEIEKALGGSAGDTSGVSQDQLGQLLEWMQDNKAAGLIMVGPPGAAKSAIAKATGGEHGVPTIKLDLGGFKGSLVGESEAKIRHGLKVIDAVSGGRTMWIATCNSLGVLPPELRRRFKFGTWFNDLPTEEERTAIWNLYLEKMEVSGNVASLCKHDLTGAEIEAATEIAWRMGCTPDEALDYIVPVAKAAPKKVAELREAAANTMIDAATGKPYTGSPEPKKAPAAAKTSRRKARKFSDN